MPDPDPDPIRHPTTGDPIALGPGELLYRLARPSCQTWNPADGLRFEPWPPCH